MTLIHEIAHELMHRGEYRYSDTRLVELEAEAVAYVVGKHFNMEGLKCPNYIALHGADAEMILAHMERIRKTAAEIIEAMEISQ